MSSCTVNSRDSLQRTLKDIAAQWDEHKYLRISIRTGKDRSLDQNAISHAWYEQISRELGEDSPEGVKCECKLRFGVPILRAADADFREMYDAAIKGHLSYEQKLKAMRFIPVTSLMTIKQSSQYLEDVQRHYAQRGIILEFPDEQPSRRAA